MNERTLKEDMKENFKEVGALFTILALVMGIFLFATGCNMQVVDTTWRFNAAMVKGIGSNEWTKVSISSWKDYPESDVVQIKTTDGKSYVTHYCNIILIKEP